MELYIESLHCSRIYLCVCLGTGLSALLASIKSGIKEAQHYYFAIGTHLLNTHCVVCTRNWRLLRDIKETEMSMLLIPQGGKTETVQLARFFQECRK